MITEKEYNDFRYNQNGSIPDMINALQDKIDKLEDKIKCVNDTLTNH